jgi:futalosine hydrolase
MKVLLVAATAGEVEPVFRHLGGTELPKAGGLPQTLQRGKLEVDFVISGIGMVPTVYATTRALASKTYNLALNAGIGGGSSGLRLIHLTSVYHVTSQCLPEVGAEDGDAFLSLDDMQLPGNNEKPFSDGVLHNLDIPQCIRDLDLHTISGRTVNLVTGSEATEKRRKKDFRLEELESMEGAGFFYACLKENVPFAELRAVSNYTGLRDRKSWKIPEAIATLNKTLIQLFDQLSS